MLEKCMDRLVKFLKKPITLLCIILFVGLILRMKELTATSFWFDEAFTGDTIKFSWGEMFKVISADKVHPPLYYILVRLWAYIFGFSQNAIRSFSVTAGLACVVLSYLIGKKFIDKEKYPLTGLILASVFAVSPFFVSYSVEARSYALICLESLCAVYFAMKYVTEGYERKSLIYLILSCIILFFTHYLQGVFVVALVLAVLFYKYVFTSKSFNKKLFYGFISLAISITLLALIFPIKEFLQERGIESRWWIPDLSILDTIRFHYSYLFGVIRYYSGVPALRQMIVPVSPYIIAGVIFVLHSVLYALVMNSKSVDRETKRRSSFLFVLWSVCYFGFILLGLFGINTIVERYTIACGACILLSLFVQFSILLGKKTIIFGLIPYFILIMLVQPLPPMRDLSVIVDAVEELGNVNRIIFKDPGDYVIGSFYLDETNCYYIHWDSEEKENWAIPRYEKGLNESDLSTGDILVISPSEKDKYVQNGFEIAFENTDFVLLKKL